MLTCNTKRNNHAPTNMMIISITLMLPLALTYFQKFAGLLKFRFIHPFLDSSHVCLNNFKNYEKGSRNHSLNCLGICHFSQVHVSVPVNHTRSTNDFWKCKWHNWYLLKIYLVKAFPHHHFHESERNLMTLRFNSVWVPIHANLSKP